MMGRFSENEFGGNDEGDYYDYDGGDYEESGGMIGAAIPAEMIDRWKYGETQLESRKINLTILRQAIRTLEKSWWWRFRSVGSQMGLISSVYHAMFDMVNPTE